MFEKYEISYGTKDDQKIDFIQIFLKTIIKC